MTSRVRATSTAVRATLLAALLFTAYASTLGLDAFDDSDYGGDEPHYLLAAKSLVEDGDLDVLDGYAAREYAGFYPLDLDMHGEPRAGSLHEPHGVGFPALIAPAFGIGGAVGVELLLALIAAVCVALSYLLARRAVPDPWALAAALAVGLSPPFVAYGSAVYPELSAGAALAGAALLALRLAERPSRLAALGCALLIAALPWLGVKYAPAGLVIGVFGLVALRRHGRRLVAVGALGVVAAGAIVLVLVNQGVYGGPTPYAADFEGETPTDASSPLGYLERAYRAAALFIDRDYGLLRWAPVFVLGLVGAWLLLRRRGGEAAAPLGRPGAEPAGPSARRASEAPSRGRTAALLCGGAFLVQVLVAAFLAPTMFGFWFPGRHVLAGLPLTVPLVAWGFWRLPRTGAVLAGLGIAASVWTWLAVRLNAAALATGRPDAPWGPLDAIFPFYGDSALPYALTAGAAAVLLALVGRAVLERLRDPTRHSRQMAGITRRRYSG